MEPKLESNLDVYILTMEEIKNGLEEVMGGRPYKIINTKEDEKGIYEIELETTEGEKEHYHYSRKTMKGGETILDRFYLDEEGNVESAEVIAYFRDGRWEYKG